MQDVCPDSLTKRDAAINALRRVLDLRGYERSETPILEQTELYIRKSGGGLSSRLYDFSEPGGLNVSLRPEFTAAILRQAAERSGDGQPVRVMYDGPVFRYANPDEEEGEKTRQFTQFGAELIGAPAPSADGEVIAMALEGLDALGISDSRIVIGHVGVVVGALGEFNLSERAKLFLINNIALLKAGQLDSVSDTATELGFISDSVVDIEKAAADRERITSTIEQVMAEGVGVTLGQNTGVRSLENIVSRLARKMSQADNPEDFKRALGMLARLSQVSGEVDEAFDYAQRILRETGVTPNLITPLLEVIDSVEIEGISRERITIDFGMARGIAYYTGMLFDLYSCDDSYETLGGGGRYDGLTRALGYDKDVPSLGFAYNLDSVAERARFATATTESPETISPSTEGSIRDAVAKARLLRGQGKRAAINFNEVGDTK